MSYLNSNLGSSPHSFGSFSNQGNTSIDIESILKLVKTDQDFRNDLKAVIAETIKPELDKLKEELIKSTEKKTLNSKEIIEREFPGSTLEKWTHMDEQAVVYGFKEMISVDMIRYNNVSYLCCIKQNIDVADVVYLVNIGRLYRSLNPKGGLSCVIISPSITPSARGLATKSKIRMIEE